ncbi:hypothetical protein SaSA20_0008 [Streptococcus agalactiae]|nr:hypothetical protein SaSA20_0008 [Streptococcus agalactiae]CCW38961.1 hypothetical protein MSA_90 [Streptococcus agalactiae ILRI005]
MQGNLDTLLENVWFKKNSTSYVSRQTSQLLKDINIFRGY